LKTFEVRRYPMTSHRYFIHLAYDGSRYHGWQKQSNARTVQQEVSAALHLLLREEISLTGCGRTDAGVHAREFFAHMDLSGSLVSEETKELVFKLNRFLDPDIVIFRIFPVKPLIHARFSAGSRTYRYYITRDKDPFLVNYSYHIYGPLNVPLMNEGAAFLLSVSDFTSFSKVDTDTRTNICRVTEAVWTESGHKLVFTIRADRFLRNMVRAIVGTLLELGREKISFAEFQMIIAGKNRSDAGDSVPACGLFLEKVEYPGME